MKQVPFGPLDPGLYREVVRRALAEDLGWGDVTTEATVAPELMARGIILAKSPCVIAGVEVAPCEQPRGVRAHLLLRLFVLDEEAKARLGQLGAAVEQVDAFDVHDTTVDTEQTNH